MSKQLYLTVGTKVRNIRRSSSFYSFVGFVVEEKKGRHGDKWLVQYQNGKWATYFKEVAHNSLEVVDEVAPQCKCIHDELCRSCAQSVVYRTAYGAPLVLDLDYAEIERRVLSNPDFWKGHPVDSLAYEKLFGKRRVLKKVRRNVISGKTQDDMVKEMGHARGVGQFNTRCLGLSTGQAMARIADAMMHPTKNVRLWDVDHAITDPNVKAGRHQLNQTFVALVESLIAKNNLVGFQFDQPKQYISFNPIVTEETYVETH